MIFLQLFKLCEFDLYILMHSVVDRCCDARFSFSIWQRIILCLRICRSCRRDSTALYFQDFVHFGAKQCVEFVIDEKGNTIIYIKEQLIAILWAKLIWTRSVSLEETK